MAIYNSVTEAGFDIVAAHPVKAEMSVASPKSLTKEPINLDAILVCKKEAQPPVIGSPEEEVLNRYNTYMVRFELIERQLSSGDCFVIACSQAIVVASIIKLDRIQTSTFIRHMVDKCSNKSLQPTARNRVSLAFPSVAAAGGG